MTFDPYLVQFEQLQAWDWPGVLWCLLALVVLALLVLAWRVIREVVCLYRWEWIDEEEEKE